MSADMKPDFVQMERDVLDFWNENNCFEKLRDKNKNNKRFRFLDGPITANNPMGIHHAWGRSIKDIVLRYKAMNGCSCHYRNGFDTQGLWVEVEVEKELGFKNKKDVEAYGMDNFTRKCVERIEKYSGVITGQSKRLGQWMDWDNSYYTHTDGNISAIWHFLKICNDNGWITKAHRPMPWCPRCGTSLSEHEMAGSHKDVTHTAVFVVASVPDAEFDVLVWTTTPWTLSANAALAVNPELDYALVKCEGFNKPLVLAKNAIKHIDGHKQVLRLLKGSELTGLAYEPFFPSFPGQQCAEQPANARQHTNALHTIIPWADVDADEGSGIVHIAPGCGAEDYNLGKTFGLPEICPIDESGIFTEGYGFLTGKTASQAAEPVFEHLRENGMLFKTHEYTHSYPVCWRCKTEVLFRLVREWYIKTDEIRPRLMEAAQDVQWEPPFIGLRMLDWLSNMGDWNISRKRFYGLPLPFYPCEACDQLTVIGSKEELTERGGEVARTLRELHRPWIDEVTIKCPHCGATVTRIPEVGDVWLDAGIVPFSTLGYFSDRTEWERNFPAEWVIEMQEQVRLWFYSQLFMSVVITGRAPYERVLTNNWVLAEDGTRFSKTGHMIHFNEAADRAGADAIRYLFAGASMLSDVRFGYKLCEESRRKLLGFWNIYTFFMTYAEIDNPMVPMEAVVSDNLSDRWLSARLAAFITKATKHYESYNTAEVVREFEQCVDDVSNWYVRINRRRFWKEVLDKDKQHAYNALFNAITVMAQVMAPIIPFMTEHIWQNMVRVYGKGVESVHLSAFPVACDYNPQILTDVENVRTVITQSLKLRNQKGIKVRQPLPTLYLGGTYREIAAYDAYIRDALNVKEVIYLDDFGSATTSDEKTAVSTDGLPVALSTEITPELKAEGIYREILRHCQVLRKDAGFAVIDRVTLSFETSSELIQAVIEAYKDDIARETLSEITQTLLTARCNVRMSGGVTSTPPLPPVMEREVNLDDGTVIIQIAAASR